MRNVREITLNGIDQVRGLLDSSIFQEFLVSRQFTSVYNLLV